MGTLGIDTTAESTAILARLNTLSPTHEGVDQGENLPVDQWGQNAPYRDVSFGSVLPTSRVGRAMGIGEGDQPHAWTFEVRHVAATRKKVRQMSQETDASLIGWAPSANATDIRPYYYVQYDSRNQNGAILSYTAVRFYECIIGVLAP